MATSSFAVFASETSIDLSPEQIERELTSMWKPLSEAQGTSVSRVVLGNVLWLGCSARLDQVRAVFQKVVPRYPARVFLLEYQENSTAPEIKAAVNAQCFLPAPGAAPVCCEVVHLTISPNSAWHVRGVVAPLLVPDVQTVLWTGLGSVEFPHLTELQQHVDRTIRMSSLATKPAELFRACAAATHPTLDLSWFRTSPLREQITGFFDDPATGFDLGRIRRVEIETRGEPDPLFHLLASMVLGWLGSRLGWRPGPAAKNAYLFHTASGPVSINILRTPVAAERERILRLVDQGGLRFELTLSDRGMELSLRSPERALIERHLRFHELSEDEALGLALNTPSRARHFREAAALAGPLLQHIESQTTL